MSEFIDPDELVQSLEERIKALEEALNAAIISLRDLDHDWPKRELHESLAVTIARGAKLLGCQDEENFRDYVRKVEEGGE